MSAATMKFWFKSVFIDLKNQVHLTFLPPLMIYLAAGLSGLTTIAGTFFVKDYLNISAAALAGVNFWAVLPWALKMSFGHLVDVIWKWKSWLVVFGAGLVAISLLIMVALIRIPETLVHFMPLTSYYVASVILSAIGMVIQDAVADALSVEAVPVCDERGEPLSEDHAKSLHTTMQTLGRIALIGGLVIVSVFNIFIFKGVEAWPDAHKTALYADIYMFALIIPLISVSGVIIKTILDHHAAQNVNPKNKMEATAAPQAKPTHSQDPAEFNAIFLWGGIAVFALVACLGIFKVPYAQELTFLGSISIVLYLMQKLLRELSPEHAKTLFGTAIIIFVFRAVPGPGPGATWFEIDRLGFDQQFISVLTLITSGLTLIGMILLRPLMAKKSITYIVVLLTLFAGLLSLPNIGLYYGVHHITSDWTGGVVDARFIALLDTAIESPLGQVAMIPMLAWIARHAPPRLKATFFAVMASFTNLALSASNLATKYLNQIFLVTRDVKSPESGTIEIPADYSQLGWLLICCALIGMLAPLAAIWLVRRSRLKVAD